MAVRMERTKSTREAKARPNYKTTSGEKVPGVTTILELHAKPALVFWAFNLAREFPELKSHRDYTDDLADVGKIAHRLINAFLLGETPDLDDYTPNDVKAAELPFSKFKEWAKGKKIEVVGTEKELVSDVHRYGGTVDLIARIDDVFTILDFKTGKGIYTEMFYQAAAYAKLVEERMAVKADALRILQIGRVGAEGFTERVITDYENYWLAFKALRELYQIEKDIEWNDKQEKARPITDANVIHIGDFVPRALREVPAT